MSEWPLKRVGELVDGLAAGVSVRAHDGDSSRPAVLKTSAVTNGRVDLTEVKAIIPSDRERARCEVSGDSIIISRMNTPALVGAVGYVERGETDVFLPDRLWLARSRHGSHTNLRWLAYSLGFGQVADSVRGLATGTSNSMKNIPKARLLDFQLPVPESKVQDAIADSLLAVDRLIEAFQRLIAKKVATKRGMMQELLTGKTRLPGFTGAWRSALFAEVANPVRERAVPQSVSGRVVELEHIEGGTGVLIGDADVSESISMKTVFAPSDVLFGKLRAYLRKFWLADRSGYCSTEIWALRARPGIARGEFVRYIVESDSFIEAASTAYGTHMPRSDWNVVSKFEVALPPLDEQTAIADVLATADAEITTLKRRLESARAIKQGMMQELLTGRTRLVVEGVAA